MIPPIDVFWFIAGLAAGVLITAVLMKAGPRN